MRACARARAQVPQYLVQAGFACVACTQPRRISTIALCRRVAAETLNEFGSQVAPVYRKEGTPRLQSLRDPPPVGSPGRRVHRKGGQTLAEGRKAATDKQKQPAIATEFRE